MSIVKSVEDDPFFTCYSVVDERSAAYFAIGLTLEEPSPVALMCTSAQATRNYIPGLTEAYYRNSPIVAITADYDACYTGQLWPQVIRQMEYPNDAVRLSVDLPLVKDDSDYHLIIRRINQALDTLKIGPTHINVRVAQPWIQGPDKLETARKINTNGWPALPKGDILVLIGSHTPTNVVNDFAKRHGATVCTSLLSNYHGAGVIPIVAWLKNYRQPNLLITLGGVVGEYGLYSKLRNGKFSHWHIAPNGDYADTYRILTHLFKCKEETFFQHYAKQEPAGGKPIVATLKAPGSNKLCQALIAKELAPRLPKNSNLHLGILDTLRNWERVTLDNSIKCYSNVAGFGIDGGLSTFLGQSVVSDDLCFMVIGDLSFFYDMNILSNRHLKDNIRIIIMNNGGGCEFKLKSNPANVFGASTDRHTAAIGHRGNAEGWAKSNGFLYTPVHSVSELDIDKFIKSDKRALMEIFTTMVD